MYSKIHELVNLGLNKSQIARHTGLSRPTVIKYLSLSPDELKESLDQSKERSKKPDQYQDELLNWLRAFPDLSGAQIYDRLEERYKSINFCESTLRSYIAKLRKEYDIPKTKPGRCYEAISDPPMGQQMQVDFAEKRV